MNRQSQFPLGILLVALICALIYGNAAYQTVKSAHNAAADTELIAIRNAKAAQVSDFFDRTVNQTAMIAADSRTVSAMAALGDGFAKIRTGQETLPDNMASIVRQHYERIVLPPLARKLGAQSAAYDMYGPKRRTAQYLQYQYGLAKASRPAALRQTDYQIAYEDHHLDLKALSDILGDTNFLLIDHLTGDIIYQARPALDLGGNIYQGSLKSAKLAGLIDRIKTDPIMRRVRLSDLDVYVPANDGTAMFIGAPIVQNGITIGVLAVAITSANITHILSADNQWSSLGLGETGEIYLAGADYLMRSNSRFAAQDLEGYVQRLEHNGVENSMISQIQTQGTTALAQETRTQDVVHAFGSGQDIVDAWDYRGVDVRSAVAPLKVRDMNWALIAKKDKAEILAPAHQYFWKLARISAAIMLLLWVLAKLFAAWILRRKNKHEPEALLKSTSRVLDAMSDAPTS